MWDFTQLRQASERRWPFASQEGAGSMRAGVLCIASGKGGVGKSVLAANLACMRAAAGERVCLVDFDAGLANAHLLFGLTPKHDLGSILDGTVTAEEALMEGPAGLRVLSGGVGRAQLVNPTRRELGRLFGALRSLEESFDLLIIDQGAGMGYAVIAHLAAARSFLLVTNPEVTALSDAYAVFKRAVAVNRDVRAGVVINRAEDEGMALRAHGRLASVSKRFLGRDMELAGWVPLDPAVPRSVRMREPLILGDADCPAATSIRALSAWDGIARPEAGSSFYDRARSALR
jgi:flagellar biosynthesis protein FlhG